MSTYHRLSYCLGFGILLLLFLPGKSYAATLFNVSDTITTSRPSAATPLSANAASGDTQVTVFDNGSRFLASDSARIRRTSNNTDIVTGLTIASQSSDLTQVNFTTTLGAGVQEGTDVVVSNVTAMHRIRLQNVNPIPIGGRIVINFPHTATNPNYASPSATMFSFNNLVTGNIQAHFSAGSTGCTFSISTANNTITCTTTTAVVSANTTVTILIGCSAQSGGNCTTQVPTLINPTKTASAGTADTWNLTIRTQDTSNEDIDIATIKIGTIDSVRVIANVDPVLQFTIVGIANATAINTGNTTGCTNSETTNTGVNASATLINLGTLSNAQINKSAQRITILTNASNGYTLTATSSGQLINPSTGFAIPSDTTPDFMTVATPWFGIHACGLDVNTGTWGSGATGGGAGAKYGWPTPTTSVTLASDATGPIGDEVVTGNGITSVIYASTVNATIPAGQYRTAITYVATATF